MTNPAPESPIPAAPATPRAGGGVPREHVLAFTLCALFVGFFVAAELIGAKLFRFTLFGLGPGDFGIGDGKEFVATVGILAFPLTFIMTDIVNEYFGRPYVRMFTFIAILVNLLLQPVVRAAIHVPTISFTPGVTDAEMHRGVELALGQTTAIVVASLCAFAIGQWLDVVVFSWFRRTTKGRFLWLRAQGSTVVSQLVDTFVVIFLAFVVIPGITGGEPWPVASATSVSVTNYVYKLAIAVGITPLLYLVHFAVDGWLGKSTAEELVRRAHAE